MVQTPTPTTEKYMFVGKEGKRGEGKGREGKREILGEWKRGKERRNIFYSLLVFNHYFYSF